jgi:hypothetical protein
MPVYHKDVFLPRRIKGMVPAGIKAIQYSNHALQESKLDKYGQLPLPVMLDFATTEIVEITTDGDKAHKIVVRHSLKDSRHLCLVLIPTECKRTWLAKTVWCNLATDNHDTLNKSNYVRKP